MVMRRLLIIALLMIPGTTRAQWDGGVEMDVLPYVTGGWFGAGWLGSGHVRVRALAASVNMPFFVVQDGFTDNEIRSVAVVAGDDDIRAGGTRYEPPFLNPEASLKAGWRF